MKNVNQTPLSVAMTSLLLKKATRGSRRVLNGESREFTLDCTDRAIGGAICVTFTLEYRGAADDRADELMATEAVEALLAKLDEQQQIDGEARLKQLAGDKIKPGDIGYLHDPAEHWRTGEGKQILMIGPLPAIGVGEKWAAWSREKGVHEVDARRFKFTPAEGRDRVELQFDYIKANGTTEMICDLLDQRKIEEKWAK